MLTTSDAQHTMFSYQVMLPNYPSSDQNLHSTVILLTLSISGLSHFGFGGTSRMGEVNSVLPSMVLESKCAFFSGNVISCALDANLDSVIGKSRVLVVEGYL